MKLFHYQRRDGVENFGDRLNLWLWPQLLPDCFDDDAATVFVGIGTLLNHRLPERLGSAQQAVIFSTGVGYERSLRSTPPGWKIYCVRGPLSAKKLGLPASLALTDGAILLRQRFQPAGQKRVAYAFMPHIHHATFAGEVWQQICREIGFGYIDPRWSVEEVLAAIGETEVLLAEAMHGAIAAEALRVPWLPVQTSARILPLKWQDWCASIRVPFRPIVLPPVLPQYPPVAQGLRSGLRAGRYWLRCGAQSPQGLLELARQGGQGPITPESRALIIAQQLLKAQHTQPILGRADWLETLEDRLCTALDQFQQDRIRGQTESA